MQWEIDIVTFRLKPNSTIYHSLFAGLGAFCLLFSTAVSASEQSLANDILESTGEFPIPEAESIQAQIHASEVLEVVGSLSSDDAQPGDISNVSFKIIESAGEISSREEMESALMGYPSMVGWFPISEYPDPKKLNQELFAEYRQAVIETVEEMGFKHRDYDYEVTGNLDVEDDPEKFDHFGVVMLTSEKYRCKMRNFEGEDRSNCAIGIQAGALKKSNMPAFSNRSGDPAWQLVFPTEHHIRVLNYETLLPRATIHTEISERLSERLYTFMPDSVYYIMLDEKGQAKGYPYWLQGDDEITFLKP